MNTYKYGAFGRFKLSKDGKFLCRKCGQFKERDEFFKSKRNPCGLAHACKPCFIKTTQDWRKRNKEKVVAYALRWNANHPEISEAHRLVKNALKNKTLKKQPCEVCSEIKSQAHHDDYSKPLDVRWLCVVHHSKQHRWAR